MNSQLKDSIKTSIYSIKSTLIPGYIILAVALLAVLSYYFVPEVTNFFASLETFKQKNGYLFSFFFVGVFAGVIPWIIQMLWPKLRPSLPLLTLIYFFVVRGFAGIVTNGFYELQAVVIGSEIIWWKVALKVVIDQFVFSSLYAAVYNAFAYLFASNNFSIEKTKSQIDKHWYGKIVLPNYISNLTIWLPGTIIIYSLPTDLQIIMMGLINCFFSLICIFVAKSQK